MVVGLVACFISLNCSWHVYEQISFFPVNGHQILNSAFPAGEWISAIVSECTCNCSGVSNQKFPFQPKAGINVIWVYCFLVYLLFHGWYHIIGSWSLSLPCCAVCLFCCFRLGFAEIIVMMLLYCILFCLQDGKTLPNGPVVISPDGLFPSLYREGKVFLKIIRSMELLGLQINFLIQALMIPAS